MGITIEEYLNINFPDRSVIDQLWVWDRFGNPTTAMGNAVISKARVTEYKSGLVDLDLYLI